VRACFDLLPTLVTVDGLDSRGQPAPNAAESLAQSHGRSGDSHNDSNGRGGRRTGQGMIVEGGGLGQDLSTPHLDEVSQWCWLCVAFASLIPLSSSLNFYPTLRMIHLTGDSEAPGAFEWSTRRNDGFSRFAIVMTFDRTRNNNGARRPQCAA
jgi:hypothetical protein